MAAVGRPFSALLAAVRLLRSVAGQQPALVGRWMAPEPWHGLHSLHSSLANQHSSSDFDVSSAFLCIMAILIADTRF